MSEIPVTADMVEAAKAAYWTEAHSGGGYGDKCYEAAIQAALSAAPTPKIGASRDDIAKIIDPVNFNVTAASYGTDEEGFKRSFAYGAQLVALEKADKVISLLSREAASDQLVIADTDRLKIPRLTAAWGGIANAPEGLVDHALKAAKEAMVEPVAWQTMDTAPKDRPILLDMSYYFDNDKTPTEIYVVGEYVESDNDYVWDIGDEVHRKNAPVGWIDIPKTTIRRDEPMFVTGKRVRFALQPSGKGE
ncbi:hypothetical protein [Rhizobium azibense]|uniref:Uncharacterized protein n=1 Tax=Rhizobium azibense TaxID=1136135 RepID=A0A4R3RHX0_9HYPH|nr:hypothetical protein [Rhizobium azibense]TCU34027.1 hypothetical protein EV129_11310 [Rhizobium azibense]